MSYKQSKILLISAMKRNYIACKVNCCRIQYYSIINYISSKSNNFWLYNKERNWKTNIFEKWYIGEVHIFWNNTRHTPVDRFLHIITSEKTTIVTNHQECFINVCRGDAIYVASVKQNCGRNFCTAAPETNVLLKLNDANMRHLLVGGSTNMKAQACITLLTKGKIKLMPR